MTLSAALAPLAAYHQFITYRLAPIPGKLGKKNKLPCVWSTGEITPKGSAGAHSPQYWTTYDEAAAYAPLADRGLGAGFGFVWTDADPFWVMDIDNALLPNGTWSPIAVQLCNRLAGAAVEVSQSGRGLHIIGSGHVPPHRCKNIPLGLEFYHTGRFIALTDNQTVGRADADLTDALASIIAEFFAPQSLSTGEIIDWTSEPCEQWNGPTDDDELIERALKFNSKTVRDNDKVTFRQLWLADASSLSKQWPGSSDGGYDASSADAALAARLAYWTGRDCERIERLMRQSSLYREKYERRDYLTGTIRNAASLVSTVCEDRPAPPLPEPPPYITAELSGDVPPPPDEPIEPYHPPALPNDDTNAKTNHIALEYWLNAVGAAVRHDMFGDRLMLGNRALSNERMREMWMLIREQSFIRFDKGLYEDTLRNVAWKRRFNPLRDYLDEVQVQWDGVPRIDSWLTDLLGVPSSELNSTVGAIFLIAAVRRVRRPGAKFDEMIVFEGPQGAHKSSAIAALCEREEWFTDEVAIGMPSKQLLEVTGGKWLVEAPELNGMIGRGVESMKAFLSRRFDKARMSYERLPVDKGRTWVPFSTTNDSQYLGDPTGNRRIWPMRVGAIDIAGIKRLRRQLWAEAAVREAAGASIRLPEHLYAAAAIEQAERVVDDPVADQIEALLGDLTGTIRTHDIFEAMQLPTRDRNAISKRIRPIMEKLGWEYVKPYIGGKQARAYRKGDPVRVIYALGRALTHDPPALKAVS